MADLLFHPSSVGRLMTEPKTQKEGPLSVGARTYIRELVAQAIFGVDFEVTSKEMEKGIACEVPDSIPLFNRVQGRNLVKNTQRFESEYFTGEPDLIGDDDVVDIKTAWSIATFPICWEDVNSSQRQLYEWQLRAYMQLTNKARASIAYALVTTPDDLMPNWEPQSLHFVEHIPEHHRLTMWSIERDAAKEAAMIEKIRYARAYYREVVETFDRTHQPYDIQPWTYPRSEAKHVGVIDSVQREVSAADAGLIGKTIQTTQVIEKAPSLTLATLPKGSGLFD